MSRGFISLGVAIAIAITAAVTAGGSYAVYKVAELKKENQNLSVELEKERSSNIYDTGSTTIQEEVKETSASSAISSSIGTKEDDAITPVPEEKTIIEHVPVHTSEQTQTEQKSGMESGSEKENESLKILNIQTTNSGDSTYITWETNLKSDSRIIINDDFYVSDASDSKEHSVAFSDLPGGSVVNYKIVATTDSLEANEFGKFSTRPGELSVRFAHSKDEECFVVIVEDESGNAQSGITLEISGATYSDSGMRFLSDTVVETTTSWGEVKYCDNIEEIEVENNDTGEVYYDGSLPLVW